MGGVVWVQASNILLRYLTTDDTSKVLQMSRERSLRQWIPDQVYKDEREAAAVIKSLIGQYSEAPDPYRKPLVLGVELKISGELIGHVGLSPAQNNVEIGYAIEERQQGKGYATEAVCGMSHWAVGELGLPEILGIVERENVASCRVLEKVGYVLTGERGKMVLGRFRRYGVYRFFLPSAATGKTG
jgi:ribosomal-protein-alanine N-acetyltransferase